MKYPQTRTGGRGLLVGLMLALPASMTLAAPPNAGFRVWDTDGGSVLGPGADPTDMTVDVTGLSEMVDTPANLLTNVTAWENMFGGGHMPCGITYWNPVTNDFCWFGWTSGTDRAIAMAPAGTVSEDNTSPGFPLVTYQAGDVWNIVQGASMAVHFKGTGQHVCDGTDPTDEAELRIFDNVAPFAVVVEPDVYDVWITTVISELRRLDPATNDVTSWTVPGGGNTMNVALDSLGRPVFTVDRGGPVDDVLMRLDPATNTFTVWPLGTTGVGFAPPGGFVSAGVSVSNDDIYTWTETESGAIGFLDPATDELCRISGGADTRLIETSGSRSGSSNDLQIFFTEGGFGGTSRINIVTDVELSPACESCVTAVPTSSVVVPTIFEATFSAFTVVPTFTNILPTEFVLTPTECEPGSGDLECEDLSIVSSVMRYPTPLSEPGPAGMTGVVDREGLKVLFGSLEGVDHVFEFESCALISSCGDGVVDPGEACDDGGTIGGDGCSSECLLEATAPGRMTGGGRIKDGPFRINHGQTLRCDATVKPQRLQVNWRGPGPGSSRFHMTELVSAACSDDPAIEQGVPKSAMFDTYSGVGIGRYNGVDGATITFVLKDAGEPGRADTSSFLIEDVGGTIVLDVESTTLNKGNNQAH